MTDSKPKLNGGLPNVRVCDTGFSLDGSESVELLLLQWHSDSPVDANHVWTAIGDAEAARKRVVLESVRAQVAGRSVASPLFVIAPELSFPLSLIDLVEQIIAAREGGPIVFIVGLERIAIDDYNQLLERGFDGKKLGVQPTRRLNIAAIWIRGATGTQRYLQLKRSLSDAEQQEFAAGTEALVFTSPKQIGAVRLNFAVAICSDFTNDERVMLFRRAMAESDVGSLELLFLLQMNEDQDALQFRTAIRAFYRPVSELTPNEPLTDTDKCALVFVNNASKTADAGAFGRSAFHFRFGQLTTARPNDSQPTIAIEEQGGHDYRAAVFRENRASAYWVEFVPLHRVATMPGSGERRPFRQALHADLTRDSRTLAFHELPAVIHWLLSSWDAAGRSITDDANMNFEMNDDAKAAAIVALAAAWNAAIAWWRSMFGSDDNRARQLALLLNPHISADEPRRWGMEASFARMLRAFLLLTTGKEREVHRSDESCAHVKLDGTLIAFVSGGGDSTWRTIAQQYYTKWRTRLDALGVDPLLVVQDTTGTPPWNARYEPADITGGDDPRSITASPRLRRVRCASAAPLYDLLCSSPGWQQGSESVAATVDEVLK